MWDQPIWVSPTLSLQVVPLISFAGGAVQWSAAALQVGCAVIGCNFDVVLGGGEHSVHLLLHVNRTSLDG